ncbi:hypothetical protein AKJ52_01800 [candidate division MSBL1 archaeon SCGC-AAA382C18]|uniref:Uncharacterized protein n=1 Tax=candidate division MSBL1 archaeon SCGC-AAA382C18 TaxID=1698281 RepID=A0A133VJS5_9EURY|nr:hypothetical protein AKJ52_01800 [candidate division MSBL1 archaeon SCGC-AAA382C18]
MSFHPEGYTVSVGLHQFRSLEDLACGKAIGLGSGPPQPLENGLKRVGTRIGFSSHLLSRTFSLVRIGNFLPPVLLFFDQSKIFSTHYNSLAGKTHHSEEDKFFREESS